MKKIIFFSFMAILTYYYSQARTPASAEGTSKSPSAKPKKVSLSIGAKKPKVIQKVILKPIKTKPQKQQDKQKVKKDIPFQDEDEKVQMALAQLESLKEMTGEHELIEGILEDLRRDPGLIKRDLDVTIETAADQKKLMKQMFPNQEFRQRWTRLMSAIGKMVEGSSVQEI